MTLVDFVKSRPYLFWSTKELTALSDEAIVEHILNYGDFDDVKQLISLMGIQKVASIFRNQAKLNRTNYSPSIKHYFSLYFQKHAS